ncbi:MAG: SufS family cysteine desulfurase [Chthoniobacterales bacterium]|nr:SufS family cysteine desulfurase [Chthoniobacterales bacterium]
MHRPFDTECIRADFPILRTEINGNPLVYLDNAATSQKPQAVIDAVDGFYRTTNGNIHRGVHHLSQAATDAYDCARATVARFIGAADPHEIVFIRGATEGINLVAHGLAECLLREGDEILLTRMEHHANIVPWQMAARKTGARIVVADVTPDGRIDLEDFCRKLGPRTRIAAFMHVSNALGTIHPAEEMICRARQAGAVVLLDACQSAPHFRIDVSALGCDFLVFSGHKVFGPTGIGVLYGKGDWLARLPVYQTGGDMVDRVSFEDGTTFRDAPEKFEAGTPDIAGAIGLAAACDYLDRVGSGHIEAAEKELLAHVTPRLKEIPGLKLYGDVDRKVPVLSFTLDGVHPHDIGTILDADGIAIRAGHHCAQPLMRHYGIAGTARASFAFYNTVEEADALVASVRKIAKMFA